MKAGGKESQPSRASGFPRGKGGRAEGSGEDGEKQRDVPLGDFPGPPLPRPGPPEGRLSHTPAQRSSAACLLDLPCGLGLFKINTLRPLFNFRPRTSPSTSTSQVSARRGVEGGGRVVCPGSLPPPSWLHSATGPVPAGRCLSCPTCRKFFGQLRAARVELHEPASQTHLRGARGLSNWAWQHHAHQDSQPSTPPAT